jgi:hypothetical protein
MTETERRGAYSAMEHALDMAGRGHFSPAELRDLQRLFAQAYRDTMSGDEFDGRLGDGSYSQLEDLCSYGDDEDEDETDARCHHLAVQVIASFFAEASRAGLVEPQRALEEIAKYVALPEGDAESVVGAVLNELNAGRRLSLAGERQASNEEVDTALDGIKDRRGDPMMRRVRDKVTDGDIERVLDAATDRNGRPMFPKR